MIRTIIGTVTLAEHQDGAPAAVAMMDQKAGIPRCEQTAAAALLESLPTLEGQTVTADPLHCHRELGRTIVEKGGEYLFQIKGNQAKLLTHALRQGAGQPPPLLQSNAGHGRIDERALILRDVEPLAIEFPFARNLVGIQSRRTTERTGLSTFDTRYYISSQEQNERSHENWLDPIHGHWGGVENRNDWRRDTRWNEDRTASRKPNLVGHLALLRSAALRLINHGCGGQSHCQARESMAAKPRLAFDLLRSRS